MSQARHRPHERSSSSSGPVTSATGSAPCSSSFLPGRDGHAYFNNDAGAFAVKNALDLARRVA